MLGWGELDPTDAIALSAAFAGINLARRRGTRKVARAGVGWSDPTYGTMPAPQAEREIQRLSQIAAEQRGA